MFGKELVLLTFPPLIKSTAHSCFSELFNRKHLELLQIWPLFSYPLHLSIPCHTHSVHYISSKCPICCQSPDPAVLQYIYCHYTTTICASCSMLHSCNENRHRPESGLVLLNSFKSGWVESKKKMHGTQKGHAIKMERTCASWKTQHERAHLIKRCFFHDWMTQGCCWHKPWASGIQLFIHGLTTILHWQWILHLYIHLQRDFKRCCLNSAWMHSGFNSATDSALDICFHGKSLQKQVWLRCWWKDKLLNNADLMCKGRDYSW